MLRNSRNLTIIRVQSDILGYLGKDREPPQTKRLTTNDCSISGPDPCSQQIINLGLDSVMKHHRTYPVRYRLLNSQSDLDYRQRSGHTPEVAGTCRSAFHQLASPSLREFQLSPRCHLSARPSWPTLVPDLLSSSLQCRV